MKNISSLVLAGAVFVAIGTAGEETTAAGGVTRAPDNCSNAHAVLMSSASGDHARHWAAIGGVMRAHPHWQVVPEYEPGVSQKASFRQYDAKFAQGVTAYVASCGHSATCNAIAEAVLKAYPAIPSPAVYCGEIPHVLDNPVSAPL